MTVWPRLEIGNSSDTPWISPSTARLEVADRVHSAGVGRLAALFFGPLLNQAKARHARPTRKAAMPCFTWWWLDPAS